MHRHRTLPHYAKALLSKKTGRTIYDVVSNSPSIIINGQETLKGRRKETSGLLSLFNKAYALLPQVLNILYLVALFQKIPIFFLVPCPVICFACVIAGPDWRDSLPFYMLPLSEVVKKFPKNQLQSLPSPPPLIHAAPTSVARFEFRRPTPNIDPSLEAWLHMFLHFEIHSFTL